MNPDLRHFRSRLPPFIGIETVDADSREYSTLPKSPVYFKVPATISSSRFLDVYDLAIDAGIQDRLKSLNGGISSLDARATNSELWSVAWLQEMVTAVMLQLDDQIAAKSSEVCLIYPTRLRSEVHALLRKLIVSPRSTRVEQRVVSVCCAGMIRVLNVHAYEANFGDGISGKEEPFAFSVYSPDDPPMGIRVPERGPFKFHPSMPDTTADIEWRAFAVLAQQLRDLGTELTAIAHEPVGGSKFPDFEIFCNGKPWFVEVTQILGDIKKNRIIDFFARDVQSMAERAASSPPIDQTDVERALDQALAKKKGKASEVPSSHSYCLLLVDEFGSEIWDGFSACSHRDMSTFDAVAIVEYEPVPKIRFVKGGL